MLVEGFYTEEMLAECTAETPLCTRWLRSTT